MAEHVPPTEEQLGEIEWLARKRDWDGYNAFLLRCIAEIRRLRADASDVVPRSRYEAADREHEKEMARARRGVEEMQAQCDALRREAARLAEWCDAQQAVPKEKFLRYANQEYNEGYRDAMEAVARRIREVPK